MSTPIRPARLGPCEMGVRTAALHEFRHDEVLAGGDYELQQFVLDFPGELWVEPHFHGGSGLISVISGRVIVRNEGRELQRAAGEHWVERQGEVWEGGSADGEPYRLLATYLLPAGAPLTTLVGSGARSQLPDGPVPVARAGRADALPAADYTVTHGWLELPWSALHFGQAAGLITLVAGEAALYQGGRCLRLTATESLAPRRPAHFDFEGRARPNSIVAWAALAPPGGRASRG